MTIDLDDPKMEGYKPLQDYIDHDSDQSSRTIRDMPFGKKKEEIQLSTTSLVFSATGKDHESPSQVIAIANIGYDEVTIFGSVIEGDFLFKSAVPVRLLAGETGYVQVAFKPNSVGVQTGSVTFDVGSAIGNEPIELSGTGITSFPEVPPDELTEFVNGKVSEYLQGYVLESVQGQILGSIQAHLDPIQAQFLEFVEDAVAQEIDGIGTFVNKTFTLPKINDTTKDHQYVLGVSELTANRVVTLPVLTGNDEFVFRDHPQTLSGKTLVSPTITSPSITGNPIISGTSAGTRLTVESTDAGSTSGPDIDLYRNSASPAVSDILASLLWSSKDNAGNKEVVAAIRAVVLDAVNGTEDTDLVLRTIVAGALADRLHVRAGMYMDGASGGDKGAGSFNAAEIYEQNSRVLSVSTYPSNTIYQSTDASNLVFPIGSILVFTASAAGDPNRNATVPIYLATGTLEYQDSPNGTALTGTWRARGKINNTNSWLAQRVA